jgi:hypothetical protein
VAVDGTGAWRTPHFLSTVLRKASRIYSFVIVSSKFSSTRDTMV